MDSFLFLAVFQIINLLLLIFGVVGFIMLVKVLFKLNKVLDIWLEKNRRD